MNEEEFIEGDEPPEHRAVQETDDLALRIVRRRKEAYTRLFVPGAATKDDIEIVTADLTRFCRLAETTERDPGWDIKILEGRRQVLLRMIEFSKLDVTTLLHRYHGG